ncbi:MAG: T9SS type A sorting domain-containing protein [Flavobacteriales bacterium]
MKKITLIFTLLISLKSFAQSPCDGGRYATDVFTNFNLTSDIVYGQNNTWSGSSSQLKLDFYEPTGDTQLARPLIIWVHGGSFIGGSKTDNDVKTWSESFAKKGYVCASIDYRLGFFPFDSANAVKAVVRAVQDLKGAIRFFYKDCQTANQFKVDTNHIFIGGSSAGAITALHVAYLNDACEISDYLNASAMQTLGGLEGNSGNPGYSTKVHAVINGCGALARYSWLQAGDIPLCSFHGTSDGTVKYNRGMVNPGTPLMYLDGSRMLHERACAVGVENQFYTFPGAPHVPYLSNASYMDTTIRFVRDFLVKQMGCTETALQPANNPMQAAILYPTSYCDGSPVNEVCSTSGLAEETNQVAIFPNPSNGMIHIQAEGAEVEEIQIIDLTGKIRDNMRINSDGLIDLSDLPNGSYFVSIDLSNGVKRMKQLIIQH